MPELPEVETIRLGLIPALVGKRFARVIARRPDLRIALPERFAARLEGRKVESLERRAKYLLARLDSGETLLLHLGMSGRIAVHKNGAHAWGKHDHVIFETDAGAHIVFTDHRRFGLITLIEKGAASHPLLAGLGPEPLSLGFTAEFLSSALKAKQTPIKAALLDQRVVAGLGNIYACEALFRARISPKRLASTVVGERATRLVPAIRAVLEDAIASGGSSLRDYARVGGELGDFQHKFQVYGRAGRNCLHKGCKATIKRFAQSGRSTFYCPKCQT